MATLEERIYDGNRARECLENEQFNWAFDSIKQELTEAWQKSPARDAEAREKIYLTLQLLTKLKAALTSSLESGQLAEAERIYQQSLMERAKESLRL
jgi:hypothetical protein